MKTLITLLFVMIVVFTTKAQKNDIETQSVAITDLINFVAETYKHQDDDDIEYNNITFVFQVANQDITIENLIILKQAFKLLSERLNDTNSISLITYFGFNGVALKQTSPKSLDTINKVLSNLKNHIESFHDDGIELAYQYAEANYDEHANNSIVIIRNTNATNPDVTALSKREIKIIKRRKRNKVILTTAVGLLPEIITFLNK